MGSERIIASKIYSIPEGAKLVGLTKDQVYAMMARGEFPYIKLYESGKYRVCGFQLLEWLRALARIQGKERMRS